MMTFTNRKQLRDFLWPLRQDGKTVGFVPTMGALHAGHLSLLQQSVTDTDVTVISIFVNPTQFNNPDDLKKYPRTLEADSAKIQTVNPDIVIFAPEVSEMYGENTVSEHFDFGGLENQMEGKFRPGHFDGVGTIVKKLFEIVEPDKAYFGEKDFQQLQIIRKLVEICQLPVSIVECPILREPNGLAMSSRNERLSPEMRHKAAVIYKTLLSAKTLSGTENANAVREFVKTEFDNIPDIELEYFEIANESTLEPAPEFDPGKKYRFFIAVHCEGVRLIDTISL
ncbi:pantoate--beta-alanine ligase [Flavobacterium silvaticum]|uniref:Pantothenate synthetase n=1 Tax=Flavobacterium silvaticum TaxID=1852020 RepID=A0A972FRV0_9FLAO|nr:pantoate--beta-alanine ligase [Flavobacterium silvaticum]NMH28219.1 pantoate--beta-alanine ligase [Flavobacterium silvaticum]